MVQLVREFALLSLPPGPQRRRLALGLLCTFGAGLATLLLPTLAGRLVEAFPTPGRALIGVLALALAARSVLGFVGTTALGHVAARAVTDLRRQLFGRLLHAPLSFHHSRWSSELVSTLGADTSLVEQLLQALLPSLAQFVPLALAAALALAWLNPPLTAGLAVAALPLLLLLYLAGRALRRIGHAGQARLGELSVLAQESLRAAWLVKSLTREALFVERVATAAETLFRLKARRVRWQAILDAALPVGAALALVVAALVVQAQLARGSVSVDQLTVYGGYLLIFGVASRQLVAAYAGLAQLLGAAGRLRELWSATAIADQGTGAGLPFGPGALAVHNVSFSYPNGRNGVNELSFALEPGAIVGLVGPNGAGKSTLIQLLVGLHLPQRGTISLDGMEQSEANLYAWRRAFGLVTRDPVVFHMSLGENIALGRPGANQAQIAAAATAVGLHSFICDLPDGYKSLVGEGGVQLSAGQRQRVALARLLLQDPRVVVLDEATLSLDAVTEEAVTALLRQWQGKKTVIIVAHQQQGSWPLTRLLRLDGGRIVEDQLGKSCEEARSE